MVIKIRGCSFLVTESAFFLFLFLISGNREWFEFASIWGGDYSVVGRSGTGIQLHKWIYQFDNERDVYLGWDWDAVEGARGCSEQREGFFCGYWAA